MASIAGVAPSSTAQPRVAFVAGSARTLLGARSSLIRELGRRGGQVLCVAPSFTSEQQSQLLVLGAEHATFELVPKGPSMLANWQISRELAALYKAWKPDVLIGMSERVMALALLASRGVKGLRRVALLNGFVPRGGGVDDAASDPLRASPKLLARALKLADHAVFHNQDDIRSLEREGALPSGLDTRVVPGAGVDLEAFAVAPLPPASGGLVFLMFATLDVARGVLNYCEAARRIKARVPKVEFLLAGPAGEGAGGISADVLRPFADSVTFLGVLADVRPTLARCHVFVYPSHAEGMPRAVLEALAAGRPVITTTVPGCRETVDDCVNGMLVAPGQAAQLEDAMMGMVRRPELLVPLARASRLKAERHFGEGPVISTWLDVLGFSGSAEAGPRTAAA